MRTRPICRQTCRALSAALLVTLALAATSAAQDGKDKKRADVIDVNIKKLTLIPETITIKVGQTVRWTNNDDRDFQLVARDRSFTSGNLRPKDTFEHKFAEEGSYEYACALHPRLIGTIVVEKK